MIIKNQYLVRGFWNIYKQPDAEVEFDDLALGA